VAVDHQDDPAAVAQPPAPLDDDPDAGGADERDEPDGPLDDPAEEPAPTEARQPRRQAAAGRLLDRLRQHYESQRYSFVPKSELVAIDARQHPLTLVIPVVRTFAGLALLLVGPLLLPLAWFALVTGVWARVRLAVGLRRAAVVGAGAAGAVVVLHVLDGRRWDGALLVLLLGWLLEDLLDWHSDRLVVTDKRIYRRHGVLTKRSPSISLTAIAYIDAAVPPLGHLLHYGTLRLDSVAQRDDPLSRFDLIPDVVQVSHEILRLRAAAMPKGPPQTF
jgi:hypothetical protein